MAEPRRSQCCNFICRRGENISDFCSGCIRLVSPSEYYAINGFDTEEKLRELRLTAFKNFGKLNKQNLAKRNGVPRCCNARTVLRIYESVKCCKCGKEIEWSFGRDFEFEVSAPEKQTEMEDIDL